MQEIEYKLCVWRRLIGGLLAVAPLALAGFSIASTDKAPFSWFAFIFGLFALYITYINFYFVAVRPLLWRRTHGNMDDYKHASVIPALATISGIFCCVIGYGNFITSIIALVVFILDMGGFPWFVYGTWKDKSFWDTKVDEEII